MQIIGEKINGTRKRIGQAIAERDANYIQNLARRQAEAGSTWLDVNAGTHPDREPDDLVWLVETVQAVVDTPLSLDSTNPQALAAALRVVNRTPLINSISGEAQRLAGVLPLAVEHGCPVIALTMDDNGIPENSAERVEVAHRVIAAMRAAGIPDARVYVDALAMALSTNAESAVIFCETVRAVRAVYSDVHFTVGLSNISYGLPARSYVNRAFLTLAMAAGLDCAILDPLDEELRATRLAAELALGRDEYCLRYVRAYRSGVFGQSTQKG